MCALLLECAAGRDTLSCLAGMLACAYPRGCLPSLPNACRSLALHARFPLAFRAVVRLLDVGRRQESGSGAGILLLPKELYLSILRLAAYPLSAWVLVPDC